MSGFRSFFKLALLAILAASASAQVSVQIQMPQRTFVGGERIPVSVTVTNHSGRDLDFEGSGRVNWLDFHVMSGSNPLSPLGQPAFGKIKIPVGQSLTRSLDLSRLYSLQTIGNFSVYALVRLPGQTTDGTLSNRLTFDVYTPRPYWTQKVGTPDGRLNEFRVMNYVTNGKTVLYTQVVSERTGNILQTQSLGEMLTNRKPSIAVDKNQVMHVLYQITPAIWGHARMAANGTFLGRDLQKPAGGDPQLVTGGTGEVRVLGSVLYDPKAEAEEQARLRKANDRPDFLYR